MLCDSGQLPVRYSGCRLSFQVGHLLKQMEPVLGMLAFQKPQGSHKGGLNMLRGAGACNVS